MKYYFAPLEGISGYIYRNAYEKFFPNNIDKYFTPFIVPNQSKSLKTKEFRDVLPENNNGLNIIPQILTNDSKGFIATCKKLKQLGYDEVNLNLGCPSGTVVSKFRGSGFLAKREELDNFLDEIFKIQDMKISIKTRLGVDSADEFYEIMKIYDKYPMEELIIHPRTRQDFYGNKPNMEMFKDALKSSKNTICYNGDIFSVKDYEKFIEECPSVDRIMIGRGSLANPGLINEIKGKGVVDKNILKEFHDEVCMGYKEILSGDINVLFRMKELWSYMIGMFEDSEKVAKKIKKERMLSEYNVIISRLFAEYNIDETENRGFNRN
ncbi:MAG: tRNA-dihydrouridine synthase family protein [Sarcina ventriculi]|uniref:tRNA-dihydrouridine synthase n=1 Tax=Sarcina ventriculi TaxID=1267 RepID=A0ABP2AQ63_SARVE|nr:tRNA-dihydrouridine synthase family protein [Sarcina ventriculi]MDO4401558.1 tRNA-dihydrouridine synthase family protein [Clostridiaceae bacterium]MBU5322827.1 tRNA-dihydrouridine synthase family protein [Sarcina ventriculi]MCI5635967.1 tRNA-dihydrouridine synthase family protein [Sarcina ventriculi]MDD7372498.1 tRNA-dihydrouridine synthase family protein [Sarcina ventriculi]MDY7061652.1 tRNA-dihydrouridine synthase family protein [Sarcina ventriculi]